MWLPNGSDSDARLHEAMDGVAALDVKPEWPNIGNGRAEARIRLLYRTARLVLGDHEILAVIRNVSRTGVGIRTFGAIELPTHMQIELASGTLLSIKKEWQNETGCGASFRSPIDVELFLTQTMPGKIRRPLRVNLDYGATLKDDLGRRPALIRNIGIGGAMIELEDAIAPSGAPQLVVKSLGSRPLSVKWSADTCFGVQFDAPFAFAELAEWVTGLTRHAMAAAPASDSDD